VIAALIVAAGALVAPAPPAHVVRIQFVHSVCRSAEVPNTAYGQLFDADYDVPAWDDAVGAQVGVWSRDGVTFGYSYQEDGLVYRTAHAADICPVYREV